MLTRDCPLHICLTVSNLLGELDMVFHVEPRRPLAGYVRKPDK